MRTLKKSLWVNEVKKIGRGSVIICVITYRKYVIIFQDKHTIFRITLYSLFPFESLTLWSILFTLNKESSNLILRNFKLINYTTTQIKSNKFFVNEGHKIFSMKKTIPVGIDIKASIVSFQQKSLPIYYYDLNPRAFHININVRSHL